MNYVPYYRVSTEKQGESGLGLESQRQYVEEYIKSVKGNIVGEFTDIESGGVVEREQLIKAIDLAEELGAIIVVKKLDRLSRDGHRVSTILEDKGISFIDCMSPNDTSFIKDIRFSVAKEDKKMIRERICGAMDVIKNNIDTNGYHISKSGRKITSLGNAQNLGGELAIEKSVATRRRKALTSKNNIRAKAVIDLMKDHGYSYYKIAQFLNESAFRTSKENLFSQVQVKNLHLRDKS